MAKIKTIEAREILNAKGMPTIEATVFLDDGKTGTASCSTGGKAGSYEAIELKDEDKNRYEGQGVNKAIDNIKNIITPALIGKEVENQAEIDGVMIGLDGTQNKSKLGANAMLAVSTAIAKAGAESSALPLYLYLRQFIKKDHESLKIPVPIFDFTTTGNRSSQNPDFSEFLVIPASSKTYQESIQIGEAIYKSLRQLIDVKYAKSHDYEEGYLPNLSTSKDTFLLIQQAIGNTYIKLGFDVFFGLNSRASLFFKDGKYKIKDNISPLSSANLISYYEKLNEDVHLLYFEDPLNQDDWDGWASFFQKMSKAAMIVGGDLISTNPYRLQMAIEKKAVNSVVVKPNQIGTVIESLVIAEAAKETNLSLIVSHRSNETNDDFIADFSVAVSADYIKVGSLFGGENIAKYNRLLQIDNQLKIL
jgi:enolase